MSGGIRLQLVHKHENTPPLARETLSFFSYLSTTSVTRRRGVQRPADRAPAAIRGQGTRHWAECAAGGTRGAGRECAAGETRGRRSAWTTKSRCKRYRRAGRIELIGGIEQNAGADRSGRTHCSCGSARILNSVRRWELPRHRPVYVKRTCSGIVFPCERSST